METSSYKQAFSSRITKHIWTVLRGALQLRRATPSRLVNAGWKLITNQPWARSQRDEYVYTYLVNRIQKAQNTRKKHAEIIEKRIAP